MRGKAQVALTCVDVIVFGDAQGWEPCACVDITIFSSSQAQVAPTCDDVSVFGVAQGWESCACIMEPCSCPFLITSCSIPDGNQAGASPEMVTMPDYRCWQHICFQ